METGALLLVHFQIISRHYERTYFKMLIVWKSGSFLQVYVLTPESDMTQSFVSLTFRQHDMERAQRQMQIFILSTSGTRNNLRRESNSRNQFNTMHVLISHHACTYARAQSHCINYIVTLINFMYTICLFISFVQLNITLKQLSIFSL